MCGIAGLVGLNANPIAPRALKRMCDALAHRGPNDAGYAFFERGRSGRSGFACQFVDPEFRHVSEHLPVYGSAYSDGELLRRRFSLAMGHRRLSILDLSLQGHQPMPSIDQRFWIVYNGEIYNFRELRKDLELRGYTFSTRSDTEVILALWEEHGADCLPLLNGMFALAIFDRHSHELTLARDRFGVKPLYYTVNESGVFLFASEIKGILASRLSPAEIDPETLVEYMTFQNVIGRQTIWKNIELLQPGEVLSVRAGEASPPRVRTYVESITPYDPALYDDENLPRAISDAFERSVRGQLVSDVPVGSYLSGGMDSGSIVAVAGRSIPRMHTFTAGFDLTNVNGIEQGFDERKLAEHLSYLLQTEHYAVVLHAGDMPAAMEQLSWHMDDPRVGMCHQVWYVAKLASRFVKVCLSGVGGDELFAGYPWRYRPALQATNEDEFREAYFRYWHRLLTPEELPSLFAPDLRGSLGVSRERFDAMASDVMSFDGPAVAKDDATRVDRLLHQTLAFEFRTFLQGLLVTEDHVSMAHSLETRVPFLDNELAALAWRIPPSRKIRAKTLAQLDSNDFVDSADGKLCLRQAMESYLPHQYVYQKKRGFSPPDENWYRGPSMSYIQEILLDPSTQDREWFDQKFVSEKLEDHFQGRQNHRLLVWSLLSVEWIQRHFASLPVTPE